MPPQLPIQALVENRHLSARPDGRHATQHLLRDCLALSSAHTRPSARARLEQELGQELTQKLLTSLTMGGRR